MADGGANIRYSRFHRHVRGFGHYGVRDLPLSIEVRVALRMALDHRLVCCRYCIVGFPLLWSFDFRLECLSPRLAHVSKVQRHFMVILLRCHRDVLFGSRRTHSLQRRKDCLRTPSRIKESRSTDADARDS